MRKFRRRFESNFGKKRERERESERVSILRAHHERVVREPRARQKNQSVVVVGVRFHPIITYAYERESSEGGSRSPIKNQKRERERIPHETREERAKFYYVTTHVQLLLSRPHLRRYLRLVASFAICVVRVVCVASCTNNTNRSK